jgi:hypothetical protein
MTRRSAGLSLAFLLFACAKEAPPEEMEDPGRLQLRFGLAESIRDEARMAKSVRGTAYGDLYPSEEVSVVGPIEGAMKVASIRIAIDVSTNDVSDGQWLSMQLKPGKYTFLGFFDVNDKSTPDKRRPVSGDPVTLPFTNKFEVKPGQETPGTVRFDLLYN